MLFIIIGIILIVVIGGLVIWLKLPSTRGNLGENAVAKMLSQFDGTTFNDYIVVDEFNKSHQIDHIYVGKQGVFVIETKNYSGDIYGGAEQKEWTQVLAGGNVKNIFYNPIKQNASHAYHIKSLLPKSVWVNSCVVFVQGNIAHIHADNVFTIRGLQNRIATSTDTLSNAEIENIVGALTRNNATDISKREHIKSIHETQRQIAQNICPRCNAPLVLRKGKYGDFYGCSNYPKCKFTKDI